MRQLLLFVLFSSVVCILGLTSLVLQWRSQPTKKLEPSEDLVTTLQTVPDTNGWFSSARSFPSGTIFAYPGAYKLHDAGLQFGYPVVAATEKVVTAGFDPWCTLSRGSVVSKTAINGYGDFHVNLGVEDSNGTWDITLVQGSPVAWLRSIEVPVELDCESVETTMIADGVILRRGEQTALIQGEEAEVTARSQRSFVLNSKKNSYRIVLVDLHTAPEILRDLPWTQVLATTVDWERSASSITTTYTIETKDAAPVLYTLWPHHRRGELDSVATVQNAYATVLGSMDLLRGNSFRVTLPAPSLPIDFVAVDSEPYRTRIKAAILRDSEKMLDSKTVVPEGVYFRGTSIGALTTLAQLAGAYGLERQEQQLLDLLSTRMQEALPLFGYDEEKKMLVALKPEFGNEKGNDHHFHYGYYIRAAAVLVDRRPALQEVLSPLISEMIADIASTDRESTRYPFLRSFSPYEGHSWADGTGATPDGNNQESTSEALNAWYAIKIWGDVTDSEKTSDLGAWLFSTELSATQSYWFGIDNPFPDSYGRDMASIVWGGKRDYATWFSAAPMHIVGIQLLPVTPASSYLSTLSTLSQALVEVERLDPAVLSHEWVDLFLIGLSSSNPSRARALLPTIRSFAGSKLESLTWHIVAGGVR